MGDYRTPQVRPHALSPVRTTRARAILDAQWADYVNRYMAVDYHDWWSNGKGAPQRYSYTAQNCQHYIKHVLDLAEELAVMDKKSLIIH